MFAIREASPRSQLKYGLWAVRVDLQKAGAAGKPERLAQCTDFEPREMTFTEDGKRLAFLKQHIWEDVYLGELGPDGASMKPPRRFTLDNRGSYASGWTRDSKALLFFSLRNGKDVEVFKQGLNDSVAETIVEGPGAVGSARLSPDGSWMLYVESDHRAPGAPPSPERLMRRPVAAGSPEMVLEQPAVDYRCPVKPSSPCVLGQKEGKQEVFYALDPVRGRGDRLGTIEVGDDYNWGISPDGSRLALIDQQKYTGRIESLILSDGTWHEISMEPGWGRLQSISGAANGKGFFVTSVLPDSYNLLYVTLAGKVKPLVRNGRRQWMISPWASPDGKWLAFQAQTWDSNVWMLENF